VLRPVVVLALEDSVMNKALLTKKEAAERINLRVSKLDKAIRSGEIDYVKIGSLVRLREEDVEKYIEKFVGKFLGTTHSPGRVPACIDEVAPMKIQVLTCLEGTVRGSEKNTQFERRCVFSLSNLGSRPRRVSQGV
jgi:excisionase family DNA binding protein